MMVAWAKAAGVADRNMAANRLPETFVFIVNMLDGSSKVYELAKPGEHDWISGPGYKGFSPAQTADNH